MFWGLCTREEEGFTFVGVFVVVVVVKTFLGRGGREGVLFFLFLRLFLGNLFGKPPKGRKGNSLALHRMRRALLLLQVLSREDALVVEHAKKTKMSDEKMW